MPSTRLPHWGFRVGIILLAAITVAVAGWWYRSRPSRRATEALLRVAIRAADSGDDKAAALLDQVLAIDPRHPKALLYRGQVARQAGDKAAATRYWSQVGDEPAREGGTARFLEGALWLEANRTREAETSFLKSIQLNPQYLQPHEKLLKLYAMQLRAPDIRRELDAVRGFRPWNLDELQVLINLNGRAVNTTQGIPQVETFIKADPDDRASQIALGRFYIWEERYTEAALLVRNIVARQPQDDATRALLAEALLGQLDLTSAREELQRIPAELDSPPGVWRSHGLFWMATADWAQAAGCLQHVVQHDPNDVSAVYKLGQVLERRGDLAAASKLFERVDSLKQLQGALWIVAQWDRQSTTVPLVPVMDVATSLMKLGRHAEAIPYLEVAQTWDPASAKVTAQLAQAVARVRNPTSQLTEFTLTGISAAKQSIVPSQTGQTPPVADVKSSAGKPAIQFVDCHVAAGMDFQYFDGSSGQKYLQETTGGSVAVLDYDGDGWPDLYFPQGCKLPANPADGTHFDRLVQSQGDGKFVDVTLAARLGDRQFSQGCSVGDFNNDGFPDLAVANYGTNALYQNNGDGTFTDVTAESGITGEHWSTSLGWGDLDRDGDLDLYVVNYCADSFHICRKPDGSPRTCHPQVFPAEDDILYLSRGDGTFQDVTQAAGMSASAGRGLGVIIADLDENGWPDVYVANDGTPNFLFQNLGDSEKSGLKFAEVGLMSGTALSGEGASQAGMGIACDDLDGDGRLDLFVTNFYRETNACYLNRGQMLFEDATVAAGLAEPSRLMLGFGTQALDADLDGRPELCVLNGHVYDERGAGIPWKMRPQLFHNEGKGRFAEISATSGPFFQQETLGRGLVRLDWNRDGRPDLVAVHQDSPAALLRNDTPSAGHFLSLELHGVHSNRDAIGARLRINWGGRTSTLAICGGDGYGASNERRQIVGLGSSSAVESIEVLWPNGQVDHWASPPADCELILVEGRAPLTSNRAQSETVNRLTH